jgi:uncharacterized protein
MYTLIVFAKLPVRGQVKTRIASQSTPDFAYNLYEHLLNACLLQAQLAAQEFTHITGIASRVHWHYAGNIEHCEKARPLAIQALFQTPEAMIPQANSDDLGVRMLAALKAYETPSVLLGSDIPSLDAERLLQALLLVKQKPSAIVLNPTRDGGFCLVGCGLPQAMNESIFKGVAWSTAKVMERTRLNLLSLKMPWKELEHLSDIDDLEAAKSYLTL